MMRVEEIFKFLPHRYPFLLVDRVLEMEPGRKIVALKNVTYNEPFFQGHFPGTKIMPGVLLVEALAQAGGILLMKSIENPEKKLAILSKIEKAKFKKMVIPGDQLRIEVEWLRMKSRIINMKGTILVDGEVVCEGEVYATILDNEEIG